MEIETAKIEDYLYTLLKGLMIYKNKCTAKGQTCANQLINHFITSSHQTVKYIMLLQFENPLPFIVANYWTPMALYKKVAESNDEKLLGVKIPLPSFLPS